MKIKPKKLLLNIIVVILLINIIMVILNKNKLNKEINEKQTETTTIMATTTITTTKAPTTTKTTTNTTSKVTTKTTEIVNNNHMNSNELIGTSSKGYSIEYKNGAYYVGGYLIANKTYFLTSDWVPTGTHKKITTSMDGFCRECIDETAYQAWLEMKSDAAAIGYTMWIQSGYRGYYYQKDLYNGYVKRKGQAAADKSSARPGASEHQTGLAFDICVSGYECINSGFNNTAPAKWLAENAYLYGYILRYPEGKTDETGYIHESWHFRYVGKELAKALYNDGDWITMENYFGINSKYAN